VAVVIGEAAVRIRGEADRAEIRSEVEPAVSGALEDAGDAGADAFSAKMAAGIAAAGLAIAGGFAASLEQAAMGDKLAAQLGASGQYAEDLGAIAGDLYANAYGENLGEVNDALRGVIQSGAVMEDASNEQLQSVTASVMDLATAMDQDVGATSAAVGRMIQTGLAANAEEALDLLTRGFQQGADAGGDLLDVVGEYGTTFSELGLSGGASLGLLNQALAAGIPNADFAADALREMGIIGREGGEEAAEAIESLGLSSEEYFAAMQAGGPQASAALDSVLDALRGTEDPALRASAAAALVGTQYEDLGDAILSLDPSEAEASLGTVEGAAGRMGDTLNDNASTNLTTFMRTAQQAFVDVIGGQVVPVVENVVVWLRDNLGPALDTVGGIVSDYVIPPLQSLGGYLADHEGLVTVLAYAVGTVLVAALAVWGTRSVIESAKSVGAWFATAASSSTSSATQQKSALQVVAGWVMMGARALAQGIKIAAVWTAQVVASAVSGAASFVVQVARVVAGWVLMGAQSLLQAARMAAAWVIAMGPVGWIIALVVGLVALIIANWQTVSDFTVGIFQAIWNFILMVWNGIVTGVTTAVTWIWGIITTVFTSVWTFISGIFTTVWGFIAGVWNGIVGAIQGALSWIWGIITGTFNSVWGFISGIFSGIWGFIVGVWNGIGSTIRGALDWIWGVITGAFNNVRNFVSGIFSGLADIVRGAWDAIGNGIKGAINWIIDLINDFVIGGVNVLIDGINFVNPFDDIPHVPSIPRLHSGGVFDSGQGEGLALLRDDELVATPEQRRVADDLLRGLLAGRLPDAPAATGGAAAAGVTIVENVYAAPGESAGSIAARATQGVVWNLNAGITRPAPLGASA
jgi:phage-related minor tail protein